MTAKQVLIVLAEEFEREARHHFAAAISAADRYAKARRRKSIAQMDAALSAANKTRQLCKRIMSY